MWIKIAFIGLVLRVAAILYFSRNDNYYDGVFDAIVDVDYKVYLDAAAYPSPYQRHTYRYSPLLALLVSPSNYTHQCFGKIFIALFDVVAMVFMYKIFEGRGSSVKVDNKKAAKIVSYFYCLNPVLIYLTVRGSCEGITMALAAAFWYFYIGGDCNGNMSPVEKIDKGITQRQPCRIRRYISYGIFGLWVHFRVYPIIFVPMLIMHEYHSVKQNKMKKAIQFAIQFGIVSGGVFIALAALFYSLYGIDFLNQTYFYHLTRRDNRHSKSVYFYQIYLNYESDTMGKIKSRVINRILPSVLAILTISFVFVRKRSLFFCYGLILFYFVSFNRVITDQYYMWSFCGIYFVIPELQTFKQKKWGMAVTRVIRDHFVTPLPVILWLLMALKLEHKVEGVHLYHVWLCSLFILVIHTVLMTRYFAQIKAYNFQNERKRNLDSAKKILAGRKND